MASRDEENHQRVYVPVALYFHLCSGAAPAVIPAVSQRTEPTGAGFGPSYPNERHPRCDLARSAARRRDRTVGDQFVEVGVAHGQEQPRARIGFDDVRRGSPGVARALDALHGDERWHTHLDRVSGRNVLEGARGQPHRRGEVGSSRGWLGVVAQPGRHSENRCARGCGIDRFSRGHPAMMPGPRGVGHH